MIKKSEHNKRLLDIISSIKNIHTAKSLPYLLEDLEDAENDLKNNEFKITVVGEFSSGKSTFLNAIIGKDILPHGVKETTATVTYIHNVSHSDKRLNTAVIHFRKNEQSDITLDLSKDKNALVDYVTTSEKKYHVVQDIISVDVYVHFLDIEDPIVLIDTPGMNGVAAGHKDITLREIRHSHASICLFHLRGMGKSDLEFIKELMKFQKVFFFVLNAIDDIKSNEESYENRMKAFENDIIKYIFNDKSKPKYTFGISSLKALAARDHCITRVYETDEKDLSESDRHRLLKESRVPEFENALLEYLQNSDKEKEYYKTICKRLLQTINAFKEAANTNKEIREAKIENIPQKKRILELIDKTEKKAKEYRNQLEMSVKAQFEDLRSDLYRTIQEDINNEYENQINYINNLNFEEAIKASETEVIGKNLSNFWNSQTESLSENIMEGIYEIQLNIVNEMKGVIPSISFKENKFKINTQAEFEDAADFSSMSRLKSLRKQKEQIEREIKALKSGESSVSLEKKLNSITTELKQITKEKSTILRSLGSRPGVDYITETRKVVNNGLGNAWGLFGDRYKTEYYTVTDYSAQEEYDREKSCIEQLYTKKIQSKKRSIQAMEKKVDDARSNEYKRRLWENKVRKLEEEIEQEEALIKEARMVAKSSFLKKLKQDFQNQIDTFLNLPEGEMYIDLSAGIRNNLQKSINPTLQALYNIFDQKKNLHISNLHSMLSKIDESNDVKENTDKIQLLSSDLKTLNNNINLIKNLTNGL